MRILLIDAHDSYTYNLLALFQDNFQERKQAQGVEEDEIVVIHHDVCEWKDLSQYMDCFDAVVVSPGPGNPHLREDVYTIASVFTTKAVPLLGVCLGMQSLVVAHGGRVTQMKRVKHGIVSRIDHSGDDLFQNVPNECYGTRYHSLHAPIADIPKYIRPLAFTTANDEEERCLMACRHVDLPHWGIQYHPDSICSSHGLLIVKNFIQMALEFNAAQSRQLVPLPEHFRRLYQSSPRPIPLSRNMKRTTRLTFKTLEMNKLISVNMLYDTIRQESRSGDFALLDSAAPPGKWTFLTCPSNGMFRISYNARDKILKDTRKRGDVKASIDEVWAILKQTMEQYMLATDSTSSVAPFCGGFIGWFSYEAGLQTMGLNNVKFHNSASDIALTFIERSIAVNTVTNKIYVQSIAPNDDAWLSEMTRRLEATTSNRLKEIETVPDVQLAQTIKFPNKDAYLNKIDSAKDEMRRGNSYEVCLTDQVAVSGKDRDQWEMYLSVRKNNPAPYAMLLQLGDETLLGSSPEMFLRCEKGFCELRPIKGTLKKSNDVTLETAKKLLNNEKERAENLMIVDLLRNDLHQVADIGSVQVSQLMVVEEYATLFQLVSSIVGKVTNDFTGLDVLARTLPPGSMTGAPKRRTCEILQNLEDHPRGVYSGVAGYWSVNDNHLWSVVIRSAYQASHDASTGASQQNTESKSLWTVGAGGALLAVSSPEAEWEEMKAKADSILKGLLPPQPGFDILESMLLDDLADDPCPLWSRHMERLTEACAHFGFTVPTTDNVIHLIQKEKLLGQRQKVRLRCEKSGKCQVDCQPLTPTPNLLNIRLDTVPTIIQNIDFVRYKTTERRHYDDARIRTSTKGLDEVLLYNEDGFLMEGSISNVAVWRANVDGRGIWVTPIASICLPGIMRDVLLERNEISEGKIHRNDLKMGEKIMLFNAVRGIYWGILVAQLP